jgi:hypothetical protein
MWPFSHGLPGATGIAFAPASGSQSTEAAQMNSAPLSLRIRPGAPRRPITRANSRRTSPPVIVCAAYKAKHSRV